MEELFGSIIGQSIGHLNIILVLGIALFFGTAGAKIFQKLRIPQVVGYIVIGLLIGQSFLSIINAETIKQMSQFNMFALGIIGFMIGGELKLDIFRKYGKQFMTILLCEGIFAFIIVTALTTFICHLFMPGWSESLAVGLVLGAISSATAPAATVDVLWEYKTRGILTRTVLAIVALDDGLALLLYGFASSAAGALTGTGHGSLAKNIIMPVYEIFGAIILGAATGWLLILALKYIREHDKVLTFTIAAVLLIIGLSLVLKVESILAAMVLGATIVNFLPRRSKSTFELMGKFAPPIYVLFFVLVGAGLQIRSIEKWVLLLAVVYVAGRTIGKISGSWFGATISNSPSVVRKYLGLCLFSQAGVAVGLSILASHRFEGGIGEVIILVVTTSTFLVQMIGPGFVKLGVKRAGEVGMNITEEDLVQEYNVGQVMETDTATIKDSTSMDAILEFFSRSDHTYYPVVDKDNNLTGNISISGIKKLFEVRKAADWLLACDVMEPVVDTATRDEPLDKVMENMKLYNLENVCVLESGSNKLVGILNYRALNLKLSTEVLRRKKAADDYLQVV